MGRDGKKYDRDIYRDLEHYRNSGISLIICLLSDSELRSLGLNPKYYQSACDLQSIVLYKYPIIEMAPPSDLSLFHTEVI